MKNKELIFEEIIKAKKYQDIDQGLINKIIDEEFPKYQSNKLCIKAVKNKLHQIHEVFLSSKASNKAKEFLKENKYNEILKLHTSTLERLTFYHEFYQRIFDVTGVPDSIIDIACGYNPFAISYMNLPPGFKYYAYDINEATNKLLKQFFKQNNYNGLSKTIDLTNNIPKDKCDMALVLKFLPIIEQQKKDFSLKLLKELNTNFIVVSFPTKTLTGKNVGMLSNYKSSFHELIKNDFTVIKEIQFPNEMVFIIKKF